VSNQFYNEYEKRETEWLWHSEQFIILADINIGVHDAIQQSSLPGGHWLGSINHPKRILEKHYIMPNSNPL